MTEKRNFKMDDLIRMASNNKLASCFEDKTCSVGQAYIQSIDEVFEKIDEIHLNRHKYDLHWAFEDAQVKLKHFISNLWKEHIQLQEKSLIENLVMSEDIQKLEKLNQEIEKKMRLKFKWFSLIPNLITFVEMGISLFLVIGLSKLSHSGETLIHSAYLSIAFVAIMAFFKVIIEKYWLKPQIDNWGWRLYRQASNRMRDIIVRLLGTTVAIREILQNNSYPEYEIDIIDGFTFDDKLIIEEVNLTAM